ncbi:MAG: ATP-binding protein [Cytophagales bacterium]|nr:ATP-binding protein [Cytophagales bacterium]
MQSNAQNISFEKVGLEDGLSQVSVLAIHQDHLKRMWFGTRNGLNCWDGIYMKQFYPDLEDSTTIQDYNIIDIVQQNNTLWLRSDMGSVSSLDLETMTFKRHKLNVVDHITLYNGNVLVSSRDEILTYDSITGSFIRYPEIYPGEKEYSVVYQDKRGALWIADELNNQIIKIHSHKKEVIKIPIHEKMSIFNLLVDSHERLWIATRYNGLIIYDSYKKTFETVDETSSPFYLKNITVRDLVEDKTGRIWVGTFKGLAIFDLNKNTTSFIDVSEYSKKGLSHNSIHCIYLSNDNNLWIGTYFGGVNYGRISNHIYTEYNNVASTEKPSYPVIGPIVEDEDGNIWIGTEGGGIDFFDRKNYRFVHYPQSNTSSGPSQTNIKSLFLSNQNYLFIGTFQGGLNILDLSTNKFKHYNNEIKHVNSIIPFGTDYLLATELGVKRFNLADESFTDFFSEKIYGKEINYEIVKELFQDSKKNLWIGTEFGGLWHFNTKTKELKKYLHAQNDSLSIASNGINCIEEDHLFRLWIGTEDGGISLYNRIENTFTSYNKAKNNLPSDFVFGICESRFGNLWVSTSKGLSRFDIEDNLFFNYEGESGFPLEELNYAALLQTRSGEIFVGGIDGLISFREEDLIQPDTQYEIQFSSLKVNNEEIKANDASNILSSDISVTNSFTLKPEHTVFNISYSACNYNPVLKNKYQYKLEGFDEDWVDAKFNTSVTYTNLNPGEYTFKVRGTNVVYHPITEEKSIRIFLEPPISRTWYAYTFYLGLFLGMVFLFNYFYLGKVRLVYQLKNERKEKSRIKELNLYKLQFFTNISHEFMTPLTIILSSIEHIFSKSRISKELRHPLAQIFRNAKRLKNLNRELLDFRKIEQGHLKLRFQENDIVPYLEEIFDAFSEIAEEKNIEYSFDKDTDHVSVWYDPIQMDKVFYNLLSNAFNHVSEEKGKVSINFANKIDHLLISVSDNGNGIPKEEIGKVFNRFFQFDSKKEHNEYYGSGIGLALSQSIVKAHNGNIKCESELGMGTTFTVILKKGHQHHDPELISTDKVENQFSMDKDLIFSSVENARSDQNGITELSADEAPILLIVDDNEEIRLAIKNLFVDKYHIEIAKDGNEGLNKALELQPDIIIADVKMPVLSGFEMCKKLKRNINTSHIPVAMVTALVADEDQVKGFECGADSYITKPFSSRALIARIENLFENRKRLQEKFSTDVDASTISMAINRIDQVFMENAQKLIEDHIMDSDFSVTNFAYEMGMSRTLFFKKIKTITGQTPNDFIQTIRLKKAADILLTDPTKNISEIAYNTGFSSPRYFSQCFKNHFGVIPSKYGKTEIHES